MINLEDISKKISNVLNGTDDETSEISRNNSYMAYEYVVQTEGFQLDYNYNMSSGKNFIPVFVGSLGGAYNPVANLGESNYSIQITLYYPVRFKKDFYALNDYLYSIFVGKILTYGTQKARSNISIAQYGEIQDIDLKQFIQWAEQSYKMPKLIMEKWLSMTFTLYLTTADNLEEQDGLLYGESLKIIKMSYKGEILNNLTLISHTSNLAGEPYSEQILGQSLHKTLISGSSQVFEIPFFIRNNSTYKNLMIDYLQGTIDNNEVVITYDYLGNTIEKVCVIQNASIHAQLGELLGMSLTLTPKVV